MRRIFQKRLHAIKEGLLACDGTKIHCCAFKALLHLQVSGWQVEERTKIKCWVLHQDLQSAKCSGQLVQKWLVLPGNPRAGIQKTPVNYFGLMSSAWSALGGSGMLWEHYVIVHWAPWYLTVKPLQLQRL